tara:strand:+ start:1185 stop:2009 length:825 start_codon:yes stop_codon:yes gene_type:complete
MTDFDVYYYGVPLILVLITGEFIYSYVYKKDFYKKEDSIASLGLLAGNVAISLLTKGSILLLYIHFYQFRLFTINDLLPIWAVWALTFIVIDFVYYWYHRCSHRVRFLWAVHMNHHSSEEMNYVVSLRQAWFGPITKIPFFMFMPLVGFDPLITLVAGVTSTLWGVLGHTQWINRLGLLEYVMVTPSSHRVHHGSNECYLDKNYGNFLIIWDRMFGTFAEEKEKVKYGIRENVKTFNPLKITFRVWFQIANDFSKSKTFKNKLLSIFGRPEWKP